ncbi:Transposase [Thalictrum thalictroides]|uniref:Transposase n=1 Tax=Thalictrum thalictroides TaxID=46969 RepID=A0A7J6WNX8_THATH|nr:Transposase [Thalictrum thalictroides]
MSEDDGSHSSNGNYEETSTDSSCHDEPPHKERTGRTSAQCIRVTKLPDGQRLSVTYNSRGQPIGDTKSSLSSWEAMLARSKVRIIYRNWKAVPDDVKNRLWISLKTKFLLGEDERKSRLSSMASAWTKFKSTLTTIYIRPFENDPEVLQKVPEIYKGYIPQNDWDVFLKERLSVEFKKISLKQSARRKKKKYNHRISKKGYAGLTEELKKKMGPSFDENNRDFLWKEAHKDKGGNYPDDATREVAEKIDSLDNDVKEGKVVTQGRDDVLTMALGTSEHNGRVHAAGEKQVKRQLFVSEA